MADARGDATSGGRRVLLTGARGFTGEPLRRDLESAGFDVVGTVIAEPDSGECLLDITSAADCEKVVAQVQPDFVIHLAAISFVQHANPTDFYRVNVVGTTHLLDALVRSGLPLRKVVIASSANVYGHVAGALIGEGQAMAPANHYAASKMAMEKMAATYFDRLPILFTRPFNYTGVGQLPTFLVPKIVSHFARGDRVIDLGNTDIERDFSDVRMVVDVYRRLLETTSHSRAFNICTGIATSLATLISTMEDIAGYRITIRTDANLVRTNDIKCLTGDPRALTAAIGAIEPTPIRTLLEDMFRAMR